MSHVLDFIITASILEEEEDPETPDDTINFQLASPRMKELQIALNDLVKDKGYELSKDIPARRVDYFNGGNAAMQNRVYLGASRHICPEQLRQAVLKVQWKSPDEVRIFICDEGWSAFASLPLDKPYTRDQIIFDDEIGDEF
jgi:hypothetical protein